MKKSRLEKFKIWAEKFQAYKGHGKDKKSGMIEYGDLIVKYYNINIFKCSICGCEGHNGDQLVMQLDHRDGDSSNNKFSNLQSVCPNCHSQLPTSFNRGKWEDGINGLVLDRKFYLASKILNLPIGEYTINKKGEKSIFERYAALRKYVRDGRKEAKALGLI